jgi:hypothetical protein
MPMKASAFEKGIPMLPRFGLYVVAVLGTLVLAGAGCDAWGNEGHEGDRCNPNRSSDECSSGLVCSGYSNVTGDPGQNWLSASHPIPFCPEDYCCPPDLGQATSPFCQPGCNGGAAAICAADSTNAAACAFASCAADASDPSTCPEDAGAPAEDGSTTEDSAPAAADAAPEGAPREAGGEAAEASASD